MSAMPPLQTAADWELALGAEAPLAGRRVLMIVENLPLPFDRRAWQECRTLRAAGAEVAVICPTGKGHEARYECLEGIHIYRHPLPVDARGALGYLAELGTAVQNWTTVAAG